MRDCVIIGCGRQDGGAKPKEDDDCRLHLYVMLSRATSLEDLLLLRAPSVDFLLRGPPADLRARLEELRAQGPVVLDTLDVYARRGKPMSADGMEDNFQNC